MAARLRSFPEARSSERLADRLRRNILRGQFVPGEPLPTERDLATETRLGRGSIREALRILEAQGLVQTHAGRHGGSVVSQPSDQLLEQQIDSYARTRGLSLQALVDVRAAIEPMVAQLAAAYRTEDDLASLHRVADRLDDAAAADVSRFLRENVKWHHALAAASHNDLLRTFATSISSLMYEASRIRNFATADVRAVVSKSHRRILAAIERRDAAAARRRTERDIASYAKYLAAALRSSRGGRDA
ncbi:MAG TPA: FCD domain-containing protein [Casimicrobiaceae bacterium]|nr:FCD domain-containing protein [Casimicrobiaceae bacterium]